MGVHGLWPLLESTSTSITLDCLEGKKLAIDVSIWLYHSGQGYNSISSGSRNSHLLVLIKRIAKLLFYKIRPVFVFDGSNVPELKRRVLRGRHLRKHLDMVTLSKDQKKTLEKISKINNITNESPCLTIISQKKDNTNNDIFALPNETNLQSIPEKIEVVDYLEGYNNLTTNEAKIAFLQDAKEKSRNFRLKNADVLNDSKKFSNSQIKRLLSRNKINAQLELLQKERLQQSVNISADNMKMVVIDNQLNKHILTQDDDIQIINPEKEERKRLLQESLSWPEFLKQNFNQKSSLTENDIKQKIDIYKDEKGQFSFIKKNNQSNFYEKNIDQPTCNSTINTDICKDEWSSDSENSDFEEISLNCEQIKYFHDIEEKNANELKKKNVDKMQTVECLLDKSETSSSDEDNKSNHTNKEDDSDYFKNPIKSDFNKIKTDTGILSDCMTLFKYLGLPYMTAPGEAEAQCVELEKLGLVDGVVSDDSDVWLFGGKVVYRNMFKSVKHVQEYKLQNISDSLGLSQAEFIQLGMLSGGDYSQGFDKVGTVTALELIAEFLTENNMDSENDLKNAINPLKRIGSWLRLNNQPESASRIRLRKIIVENNDKDIIQQFPNVEVFEAYAHPLVDSSNQSFRWNRVNFSQLKDFLWTKVGYDEKKILEYTHGAFLKWDNFMTEVRQEFQPRINTFLTKNFVVESPVKNVLPTKRLEMALKKLKESKNKKRKSLDNVLSISQTSLSSKKSMLVKQKVGY